MTEGAGGRRIDAALTGLGLLCFVLARAALWTDDFGNPDIGGLVYAADLVRDGGLVYVDSEEFKAPGGAYLITLIWAVLGRGVWALQVGWAAMLLLGLVAVRLAASTLYFEGDDGEPAGDGTSRGIALGVASLLYLGYAPLWEFNYAGWMMPLQALGVALAFRSAVRSGRDAWLAGLAAGAALTWAMLVKRQAIMAVPVALSATWVLADASAGRRAHAARWAALAVGGLLAFVPLWLQYAVAGEGTALISGFAGLGRGADYVGATRGGAGSNLVLDVARQWLRTFPLLGPLALLAWSVAFGASARARRVTGLAGAWWLCSLAAAGLGGARFYLHYLVQQVPALAVLAASPALWSTLLGNDDGPAGGRGTRRVVRLVGVSLTALGLAAHGVEWARGGIHRYDGWPRRLPSGRTAPQAAGDFIAARTLDDDRIWVWGWTAWPVYFWADRRAHTRIYKPLGSVTTFNTNSAFGATAPVHARPGPLADELLADFERAPPRFIAHSTSYVLTFGCETDPLLELEALAAKIRAEYVPVAQFGDISVYERSATNSGGARVEPAPGSLE